MFVDLLEAHGALTGELELLELKRDPKKKRCWGNY